MLDKVTLCLFIDKIRKNDQVKASPILLVIFALGSFNSENHPPVLYLHKGWNRISCCFRIEIKNTEI